jgi:predicted MFS family arabinose efflux permease
MLMPWGSSFAINNLHVTVEELPFLFMVSGVSSFIVMPVIGRLSDRIDKFKLFAIASCWLMVMVIIYTNLVPIPFWAVLVINILLMGGVLSRMVPAMALTTALPTMQDRGAFMSINASLQQIAGGVAAVVGGMIVVQKDQHSPLEHFGTLGIVIVCISCISIYMMSRVSKLARTQA